MEEGRELTLDCDNCAKYSLTYEKTNIFKIAVEELTHSWDCNPARPSGAFSGQTPSPMSSAGLLFVEKL